MKMDKVNVYIWLKLKAVRMRADLHVIYIIIGADIGFLFAGRVLYYRRRAIAFCLGLRWMGLYNMIVTNRTLPRGITCLEVDAFPAKAHKHHKLEKTLKIPLWVKGAFVGHICSTGMLSAILVGSHY